VKRPAGTEETQLTSSIKVSIIDFDWCGLEGEVRYPYFMNHVTVEWAKGAEDGALLNKEHDEHMLNVVFKREQRRPQEEQKQDEGDKRLVTTASSPQTPSQACPCGGRFTPSGRQRHERTGIHESWARKQTQH